MWLPSRTGSAGWRDQSDGVERAPARTAPLILVLIVVTQIAVREPHLESADRAIVAQIVAWLRRIIAGENDRHRVFVGVQSLRVIDPAAEEIRGVAPRWRHKRRRRNRRHKRCNLRGSQRIGAANI